MNTHSTQKSGFTLIELLVVTTIMIVLTAIGLVSYTQVNQRARNAKRQADIETVRQSLVLYRSDIGAYPISTMPDAFQNYVQVANTLVSTSYLNTVILDPKDTGLFQHRYTSNGTTFNLCWAQEPDAVQFCSPSP